MKKYIYLIILSFFMLGTSFYFSGCSTLSSTGISSAAKLESSYAAISSSDRYRSIYLQSLKKYTRKADIYDKFNTVMYIGATYFTKPFIYVHTKEYTEYYPLNKNVFIKKLKKSYVKFGKNITFFVSVYTPEKSYNDLNSNRSIWMVYLVNNLGESVLPVSIKLPKQKKVFLKKFFPYITDWSKQYIIKFPIYYDKENNKLFMNNAAKWIKLVITGVNGKAVLKWNLKHGTL
ncbi:hypothetical protein ACMCNP_01015 [Candidatus Acidulodesulfobacterium sp. H_13]|uniref:hypothetical protein n=1 Tax=Candidatus Acidulodesulfobacterium sp. H_13 TaxID=3395470 RepID=UPI003AF4201E